MVIVGRGPDKAWIFDFRRDIKSPKTVRFKFFVRN